MLVGITSTQDAGVQRVNAGNPDLSYLITKLESAGASGEQMPPAGALAQADIDVIRQWITDGATDDTVVPPAAPIRVTSLSPAPFAALTAPPTQIVAGFDADLDATTVTTTTFILEASNGDMAFDDGDDIPITPVSVAVSGTNPRSAIMDLTGVALADDTYRISLLGTGGSVIMDQDANALDGEYTGALPSGNGTEGGDFRVQFTITTPIVLGPTLAQIQAVIFTPTCATANCHSGALPDGGLNLSDAATSYANLVGQPSSVQAGAIRVIELDPDNSYLIQKLEGAATIDGNQMPQGAPLLQADIDVIRQWITDGASL